MKQAPYKGVEENHIYYSRIAAGPFLRNKSLLSEEDPAMIYEDLKERLDRLASRLDSLRGHL